MKAEEVHRDRQIWSTLNNHNQYLCERIQHFSVTAYQSNKAILEKFGLPIWDSVDWNDLKNDSQSIFTNVAVTTNNFYNHPHQDPDTNKMTYSLFSYIGH